MRKNLVTWTRAIADELDITDLLLSLAITAELHMKWACEARDRRDNARAKGNYPSVDFHNGDMYRCRNIAHALGHSIRAAIVARTREEEVEIATEVGHGDWSFWEGACGDETCEICDRPLWHHIEGRNGERICPASRRFWQIARALEARYRDNPGRGHESFVREMAKRA